MPVSDESDCASALNRRNIPLASSALIAASALGSTTTVHVAKAQATGTQSAITEQEAQAIGVDAYLYFYPLIIMDLTRKQSTNIEPGKEIGKCPMNVIRRALLALTQLWCSWFIQRQSV